MEFLDSLNIPPALLQLLEVVVIIAVIWIIVRFIKSRISKRVEDTDSAYRAKKAMDFVGYFLVFITLIIIYSNKLGGLSVALGVAGAGIAFALQEVIASVAGWLALMFGNFYKTGDRVQLGGIKGDVIDIGVLRTTLMETGNWVDGDLYNGRIVRIANSFVFKEPVFNYSGDFPFLWDEIKIPVMYGSNYDTARFIFKKVADQHLLEYSAKAKEVWKVMVKKYRIENAQTEPMITMIANDNWVEFTIRYVVNFKKRRFTKDILFSSILTEVKNSNNEVKLASATFDLVGAPELTVKIKQ
ncbi:MAG: mechanosensitive ion channel [Flammeovirgaceae bacterium]|nr:mechanosensitive ion channel [Flammeovirgaceae bacterium]